jgi:hypothetical protein
LADANQVEVAGPRYCGGPSGDSENRRKFDGGVSWCDADTGSIVRVTGSLEFVRTLSRHLDLRLADG